MRFLSVCSGIEAASVAWSPLGWKAIAFSEIEPFPCAVLAHHYPDTPNWGDMTKYKEWPDVSIDLLCGGTPCQSFSVAGLRKGLADPRGNLMLTFGAIAAKYRPRWLVWENVPGVLSSNGGRDFGSFLGLLGELGYGFAYRVLDAQYVRVESHPRAVPQRRRRVFVVGCLGDWRRAAAVLFERESLQGHPAPRRKKGQGVAGTLKSGASSGGWSNSADHAAAGLMLPVGFETGPSGCGFTDLAPTMDARAKDGPIRNQLGVGVLEPDISMCLNGGGMGRQDAETETLIPTSGGGFDVAHALRGDTHNLEYRTDGTANAVLTPSGGRAGIGVGVIAFDCKASGRNGFGIGEIASTQRAMGHADSHTNGGGHQAVMTGMQVRRLTPLETERLQGFPDRYTAIERNGKPAADGPRYKSHGNSWAINCVSWIGHRIESVEAIPSNRLAD